MVKKKKGTHIVMKTFYIKSKNHSRNTHFPMGEKIGHNRQKYWFNSLLHSFLHNHVKSFILKFAVSKQAKIYSKIFCSPLNTELWFQLCNSIVISPLITTNNTSECFNYIKYVFKTYSIRPIFQTYKML